MRVADFDFDLPADLIAQFPPAVCGGCWLLHVETSGTLHDRWFSELPTLLRPDDLLVMNDPRVIKARLFGQKDSGGKVELLVERGVGEFEALAFIRASHAPKPGSHIQLSEDTALDVLARQDDLPQLRFPRPVLEVLDQFGRLPLPPYIEHTPTAGDEARFQTVYADAAGAWWRWAPPACVRWRRPRSPKNCTRAPARPIFSSRRVIDSKWSTRSSPISICPTPRC